MLPASSRIPNASRKDQEVIAPLFKIRWAGLRPLKNSLFSTRPVFRVGLLAERIFRGLLLLGCRIFSSQILSPDVFSSFLWGQSAQKNPPGKSPAKSSKIHTRIPDIFLQRGPGQKVFVQIPSFTTRRPTQKPPTQIKTVCTNSLRKQFRDSLCKLSPFSLLNKQKTDKRVCANCLCKLFLFGWVVFGVGALSFLHSLAFNLLNGGHNLLVKNARHEPLPSRLACPEGPREHDARGARKFTAEHISR